jgi:signal transduction histidine kinase
VLGLAVACAAVLTGLLASGSSPLGSVLVAGDMLYCAVLFGTRRTSQVVAGAAAVVAGGLGLASLISDGGRAALLTVLNLGLVLAVPVLWGYEVRRHSEQAEAERERAEQTRRMAALDRAAAVTAERTRMARDLHDVIAANCRPSRSSPRRRSPCPTRIRPPCGGCSRRYAATASPRSRRCAP